MKKLIALVLAAMLCMTACIALAADLKIGAVMLGDETEGYTLAHMEGIKQAAAELGLSDSIVWKYKVPEDQTCYDSALDLVGQGCNLIISKKRSKNLAARCARRGLCGLCRATCKAGVVALERGDDVMSSDIFE